MSGYFLITTDIHLVHEDTMVRLCPVTCLTQPSSTLSAKIMWSGHLQLHPLHNRQPPSPQKDSGPAMSGNILITTDFHLVRQNTMVWSCRVTSDIRVFRKRSVVWQCLVTSFTPPTSTFSSKHTGPAMSGHNLTTTNIHFVNKETMVRPCLVTILTPPTSTLSANRQWSGHVRLPP